MEKKITISNSEKWNLFKNFMHNELGISKEDIREWMREACEEQAKLLVNQTFSKFDMDAFILRNAGKDSYFGSQRFRDEVKDRIAKEIINQINITTRTIPDNPPGLGTKTRGSNE